MRFGVAPALQLTPLTPDHGAILEHVVDDLTNLGHEPRTVVIDGVQEIRTAFDVIQMAEAHRVHTRFLRTFPDRAEEYGPDVRRRLERASTVTLPQYLDALDTRAWAGRRFRRAFEEVDVLLSPVASTGPSTIERPDVERLGAPAP